VYNTYVKHLFIFTFVSVALFSAVLFGSQQIFFAREAALEAQLEASVVQTRVMVVEAQQQFFWEHPGVSLLFVGDVMLSRAVGAQMRKRQDYLFPFRLAAENLQAYDITFGNLEGPLSSRGTNQGSIYSFRADPSAIEGLIYGGFDVMSVANNHILDWGVSALSDTVSILDKNGIIPVGAGIDFAQANNPRMITRNGITAAFLAYTNLYPQSLEAEAHTPGVSAWDVEEIKSDVTRIKKEKLADVVVVSVHWGNEYETQAEQWQKNFAHALIDAGADIVVGHHPHVAQEVEEYHGGVIFYSLGNFIFDQDFSEETMRGLAGEVTVSKNGIDSVITHDVFINRVFQPTIHLKR